MAIAKAEERVDDEFVSTWIFGETLASIYAPHRFFPLSRSPFNVLTRRCVILMPARFQRPALLLDLLQQEQSS